MHPVLKHLVETNFNDLNGSRVEGTIAVSDDLVNLGLHELIAQILAPASPPKEAPAPYDTATEAAEPAPDPKVLLRKLDIEKLHYRTESGRTVLEIACGIKQ